MTLQKKKSPLSCHLSPGRVALPSNQTASPLLQTQLHKAAPPHGLNLQPPGPAALPLAVRGTRRSPLENKK